MDSTGRAAADGRVAIIGDVGGHADELSGVLVRLGIDPETGTMPEGLTVVQVGDLIHRGPDSTGVLDIVGRIHDRSPDRWVQLVGNHESIYLRRGEGSFWNDKVPRQDAARILEWWNSGWLRLATHITTTGLAAPAAAGQAEPVGAGELLITHAGMTVGLWNKLDCPATAEEATIAIEAAGQDSRDERLWKQGRMVTGVPKLTAGIVWADACTEVYLPWYERLESGLQPSFTAHQAHGHSNPFDWVNNVWRPPCSDWQQADSTSHRGQEVLTSAPRLSADPAVRHTRVDMQTPDGTMSFFGTDPDHDIEPAPGWEALVFNVTV